MKFVDRIHEARRISDAISLPHPSLVVLYGRRRLGKSTLLRRVLSDADLYFLADRSEREFQMSLLARVAAARFPDFDKATYHDWESLLRALNHRTDSPFTLCLDEFPYLAEQSPELPSVLQKLLDEKSLRYNLILCGSSQHMMYGLVLDSTAPLYGRADEIIRLRPLRPQYLCEALGVSPEEAVAEYAVWGGVPRYWELRARQGSLRDSLWHNVLSADGILYDEPVKLLQDDVKDIVKSATLLSYIGNGANRLSEIATRCNEPATNLSRPLRKLADLGFLEKETPFGVDPKNAKKTLYKIADPFMAFYYRFVVPYRSFIEIGRKMAVRNALDAHFNEYVAGEWERLCREAVFGNEIGGALYGEARRWWGSVINGQGQPEAVEIDVVARSMDGQKLLVGECKWTSGEDEERLRAALLRKARLLPFAKDTEIVPVLFLRKAVPAPGILLPADIVGPEGELKNKK